MKKFFVYKKIWNIVTSRLVRGIQLFFIFIFCTTNSFALDKITVALDWFLNPNHATLFVAIDQGYFKEQNLEVSLISPTSPVDPPKWVSTGKADVAITYEPEFLQFIDRDLPLYRIGSLIDHPLDALLVLKDGPIHTLADIKDKRVGYINSGLTNVILDTILKNNHLKKNDIKTISLNYSLVQALLTKNVDAITGVMRNFTIPQIETAGQHVQAFFPENYGVPPYDELILVVHKKNIKDTRWPRFLTALKKAQIYLQQHPDEMWLAFIKAHPEVNDALNLKVWKATLPYFAKDPTATDRKQWETFANFLKENHMIEKVQPLENYSVVSPIK